MTVLPINFPVSRSYPSSCRAVDRAREEQAFYEAYAEASPWRALVVPGVALTLAVLCAAAEVIRVTSGA